MLSEEDIPCHPCQKRSYWSWPRLRHSFQHRVWLHAQVLLLGAMLAPGARTVTAALRVMGLAAERHFTNYHRVLNRATWSARQGSRILLGLLITLLVPPGATIVLGADDTVERRVGRKITAKGCYRDAVRSTKKHVIRCFGLKWVSMMLLVPVPWSRRVWALPFLTALCWPARSAARRRHKTSVDWVRQMMKQVRRWLPGRRLVLVVDGGFAAVSLALACVKSQVAMVSRLRWDAALYHPPGPQPPGQTRPQTHQGEAPTPLAGLGGALRYPLGDRGSGLVRRPAQNTVGLLAHGPVVHPALAPRRHPLCPGGGPGGEAAHGSLLLYRPAGHAGADPGVGRHALVGRGHL